MISLCAYAYVCVFVFVCVCVYMHDVSVCVREINEIRPIH